MNVLENKKKAMSQQDLHTSIERHLNMAAQIKPSLDAFNQISKTELEKPFLEMENLSLGLVNTNLSDNNSLQHQINNLKNNALHSNNVAHVVAMKYENNNGKVNGIIHKMAANSHDGKNYQVKEEVVSVPKNEKVIKTFTINIDKNEGQWMKNNLAAHNNPKMLKSNQQGDEVYNGVVSVDSVNHQNQPLAQKQKGKKNNSPSNMERAYGEMMGKMRTNKIMILVFIFAIILVAFFLRR